MKTASAIPPPSDSCAGGASKLWNDPRWMTDMPFRFLRGESLELGLKRIAGEQLLHAIDSLTRSSVDRGTGVHEVRKSCKRTRALLRLVKDGADFDVGAENVWFRETGRRLSGARDAAVILATWRSLSEHPLLQTQPEVHPRVLQALRGRPCADGCGQATEGQLAEVVADLQRVRERLETWGLAESGEQALRQRLLRTYRQGRRALRRARKEPTADHFHDWRKRVKDLHYQLSLGRNLWRWASPKRRRRADQLSELLGSVHDAAVLEEALLALGLDSDLLTPARQATAAQRLHVQRQALRLGRKLYRAKPRRVARRLEAD